MILNYWVGGGGFGWWVKLSLKTFYFNPLLGWVEGVLDGGGIRLSMYYYT
jgi:hypothetical protein